MTAKASTRRKPATRAKPDLHQLSAAEKKRLAKLDPGVRKGVGIFKDFAPEGNVVEEFLRERRATTGQGSNIEDSTIGGVDKRMATVKSKRKLATKAKLEPHQLSADEKRRLAKLSPGVRESFGMLKHLAPEGGLVEEFLRERRATWGE